MNIPFYGDQIWGFEKFLQYTMLYTFLAFQKICLCRKNWMPDHYITLITHMGIFKNSCDCCARKGDWYEFDDQASIGMKRETCCTISWIFLVIFKGVCGTITGREDCIGHTRKNVIVFRTKIIIKQICLSSCNTLRSPPWISNCILM